MAKVRIYNRIDVYRHTADVSLQSEENTQNVLSNGLGCWHISAIQDVYSEVCPKASFNARCRVPRLLGWEHLTLGSLLTQKRLAVCIHSCFLKFSSERSVS